MAAKIIAGALVIVGLASLLIWSQQRPVAQRVSGFVEADEIRLGSRVGGRVAEVLVEEGQRVEAQQELVRLEPYDLLQQEQMAAGELAARQAELDKMQAGFRPEEIQQAAARYEQLSAALLLLRNGPRPEEIDAARGRKEAADAEFVLAEQNFGRISQLARNNSASQQEYDAAEQRLKTARAAASVRRNELGLLEAGTRPEEIAQAEAKLAEAKAAWSLAQAGYRREDIQQAQAARDAAEASLQAVRQKLKELVIVSPAEGTVEALELQPGDLVPPGGPVMSILQHGKLWVRTYLPETHLNVQLGDRLRVTVDGFSGEQFAGEVSFIARQAEFTPANVQTPDERSKQVFRMKVTLVEGLDRLRPGMGADVWLDQKLPAAQEPATRGPGH